MTGDLIVKLSFCSLQVTVDLCSLHLQSCRQGPKPANYLASSNYDCSWIIASTRMTIVTRLHDTRLKLFAARLDIDFLAYPMMKVLLSYIP